MYRYTLTVPRALNDGTPVAAPVTAGIERALLDTFGGFTLAESVGAWAAPDGTIYREPVGVYTLDAEEPEPAVFDIAESVARVLAQDAVYVTTTGPDGAQARAFVTAQVRS